MAAPSHLSQSTGDEPRTLTTKRTHDAIRVDADLDEAAWQTVQPAGDFFQIEPVEGAKPTYKTEVRILYGEDAIYVGAMLFDAEPQKIFKPLGRRDEQMTTDAFSFAVDSYFDQKTAYIFTVNPANIQSDGIFTENQGGRGDGLDRSWDAVWTSATRITAQGWQVEMRIPYAMLRFSNTPKQTWGINFRRTVARLSEVNSWIFISKSMRSIIAHYGHLEGLNDIQPRKNIQISPYTLAQMDQYPDEHNARVTAFTPKAGMDVKVGLSSNAILDVSLKPDFGQVEADPAELNLTTYETVLQEKRPFFTEGAQIFDYIFGGMEGGMLYTRRIGSYYPVIASAKLTGRTHSGFSYGAISSLTGNGFDPMEVYTASRVKKELGKLSRIGGGLTYYRDQSTNMQNTVGGIDWDIRFRNNMYQFNGHTTLTHVNDPSGDLDEGLGFLTATRLFKIQGFTQWGGGFEVYSPKAYPQAVGRLRERDYMEAFANFRRLFHNNQPFGPFQRAQFNTFFWHRWSYSHPVRLGLGWFMNANFMLKSYRRFWVGSDVDEIGGYNVRETRDLDEPIKLPGTLNLNAGGESDSRKHYLIRPNFKLGFQKGGGYTARTNIEANWNVSDRFAIAGSLGADQSRNMLSWVSNELFNYQWGNGWGINNLDVADDTDFSNTTFLPFNAFQSFEQVFAHRPLYEGQERTYYTSIFGKRDRNSMDGSLRMNLTFTPQLSLQTYAQLFLARGGYHDMQILQDRETLTAFPNYPKRHDFEIHSFQSNVVLRWEYRPSSVVYFVWSQSRGDSIFERNFMPNTPSPATLTAGELLRNTFSGLPTQAFLVKINYLLLK